MVLRLLFVYWVFGAQKSVDGIIGIIVPLLTSTSEGQRRTNLICMMNIWIFINYCLSVRFRYWCSGKSMLAASFMLWPLHAGVYVCLGIMALIEMRVLGILLCYTALCAAFWKITFLGLAAGVGKPCTRANHFRNTHKLSVNIYIGQIIIIFVKQYAGPPLTGRVRIEW